MIGRRSRVDRGVRRRSGPADERRWWDPDDQAFIERPLFRRQDFPKGWRATIMVNNTELIDPYDGVDAPAIRGAREHRRLSALDEGVAYRSTHRQLLVLRTEMFVDPDEAAHRAAWQAEGMRVLTDTYRARWAEREVTPNWIETTARRPGDVPAAVDLRIDWFQVEDHTDPRRHGTVTLYEHVTLWCGRAHAVVTVRHEPDDHPEAMTADIAHTLLARLAPAPRAGGASLERS